MIICLVYQSKGSLGLDVTQSTKRRQANSITSQSITPDPSANNKTAEPSHNESIQRWASERCSVVKRTQLYMSTWAMTTVKNLETNINGVISNLVNAWLCHIFRPIDWTITGRIDLLLAMSHNMSLHKRITYQMITNEHIMLVIWLQCRPGL